MHIGVSVPARHIITPTNHPTPPPTYTTNPTNPPTPPNTNSPYLDREFWSPLLRRHGNLIPDPTMLTLLRPDCRRPHSAGNAMLVPRLKFICIELARTREGLNDPKVLALAAAAGEAEPEQPQQLESAGSGNGMKGPQQLVMRRTPKYSAIGVADAPPCSGSGGSSSTTTGAAAAVAVDVTAVDAAALEDEDVERVVAALMAQQGIGDDASEEGA